MLGIVLKEKPNLIAEFNLDIWVILKKERKKKEKKRKKANKPFYTESSERETYQ